jgi:thiamine biosynthesis lipoprotein
MATPDLCTTAGPVAKVRHVEHVMGMAVSIHVRDDVSPRVFDTAIAHLHDVDARFSTYKADSEISRLARGSISAVDCSPDVRMVLSLADVLRLRTDGYFDVLRSSDDGALTFDPSGVVKGWAVDGAADLLARSGVRSFCVNAGGDVLVRGASPADRWRIGIRDPRDPRSVFTIVEAANLCVATSGTYERGTHIVDPHTGRPPVGLASMTVVGQRLAIVVAFATAAFAMGGAGVAWVARQPGFGVCAVTGTMHVSYDDNFARYRVA